MSTTERIGAGRYLSAAATPANTTVSVHELTTTDGATVSGVLRTVPGAATVAFLMHPRQDFTHHVLVSEFLARGCAVWTQGARTMGNDLTLLHEQALLDMAAGHVFLRQHGFDAVVAVGHSGGGTLAAYYIEQASLAPSARFANTPGGRTVPLPEADMPEPDAAVFMAPHPGQGALLMRMIDPSVVDESDPLSVDPTLDPFNSDNGFVQAPESSTYTGEFIDRYRAAQRVRIARINDIAHARVHAAACARQRHKQTGDPAARRKALASGVLTVHRTDADLRCMDLALDPNDRPYGSLFGSRPDLTNYGVVGFGRVTTPEAWLSTWSGLSTRADFLRCAPAVRIPSLLIELTGDQACFPVDARAMASALGGADVTHVRVRGKHFGAGLTTGEPTGASLAGERIGHWLHERYDTRH
ncbi:alpha/beta fold hydrolase [Rhodococcus koreensis]|uniref:alpha/beta hydrolase n=1 Tax=Rhodococcus koreensis TaxID=99653 RepID=UPI0036DE836D